MSSLVIHVAPTVTYINFFKKIDVVQMLCLEHIIFIKEWVCALLSYAPALYNFLIFLKPFCMVLLPLPASFAFCVRISSYKLHRDPKRILFVGQNISIDFFLLMFFLFNSSAFLCLACNDDINKQQHRPEIICTFIQVTGLGSN